LGDSSASSDNWEREHSAGQSRHNYSSDPHGQSE
jgi:hypothetical protein